MRSSKSFSSRSRTTKYSLRDSVNCPLRENYSRQSFLISKNLPKKTKYSQYSLRQWVECKWQQHSVDFLTLKDNQWVISEQAIHYMNQGNPEAGIQFIGLLGNGKSIDQFVQSVCELSASEKEGAARQFKQNRQDVGISMHLLRLHKKNKVAYFLQPDRSKVNDDSIFKTIIKLCQVVIIFPSQNSNEELKNIAHKLDEVRQEQSLQLNLKFFPSACFNIFQKEIVCLQSTFQLYQNLFSAVTICSMEQIESIHQASQCVIEKNYETAFNVIKEIRQLSISQGKIRKNGMLVEMIIEYCYQKQSNDCQDSQPTSIHPIIGRIYNKFLCQAEHSYEQFLNKLNYHSIDTQDQLLDYFSEQEQKIMRKFQSTRYDSNLHQQYMDKLCDFITNFELKILQNYRSFKINQSFDNLSEFCQGSNIYTQLNSPSQILKNIDDLKEAVLNEDYDRKDVKEQVLILARNASRLHILGYDEKIRIAQIREEIDYNWQILHQIQLKNQEKLLQPTEQNLNREKHRNLQQRLINLNDKSLFVQSILANISQQNKEINNLLELKQNQCTQLQALRKKNQILMECIQSSSNSNAITIQQKILEVKLSSSLVQSKKQLIISSSQNLKSN